MSLLAEILLNGVVAALLMATIGYCYVLNRRIQMLQNSKGELAELLGHFDESTRRAAESIAALQIASKKVGETIQARIDKANFAIDDLGDMISKAEKTTDKVEASIAIAKQKEKLAHEVIVPNSAIETAPVVPPQVASLQSLIERVSVRSSSDPVLRGNQKMTPGMASRPPSESEQELMHALQQLVRE